MNTPREMVLLRHKIIGAMLDGRIPYPEAMRLQEIAGNIERIMECSRLGIVAEKRTEPDQGCTLTRRLVG